MADTSITPQVSTPTIPNVTSIVEQYYIYDENGNVIGCNYTQLYQNNPELKEFVEMNIQMATASYDSFQYNSPEEAHDARQTHIANITGAIDNTGNAYKDILELPNDIPEDYNDEQSELSRRFLSLKLESMDLTRASASATVIAQTASDFQSRAGRLESDITRFSTVVAFAPEENEDDLLSNNPFYTSATATSETQEELV